MRISERYEVWWDRLVETLNQLENNRPDLIVIDKEMKHWTMIDFTVPNDRNVVKKAKEEYEVTYGTR